MKSPAVPLALAALAFHLASGVACAAPTVGESVSTPPEFTLGASLLKTLLSLGLVIVALAVGLRLFARWNRTLSRLHPQQLIEVLESRRLEPKRALHVVRVEGRRWLVASCEGAIHLTELGVDPAVATNTIPSEPAPRAARFADLLFGRAIGERA